MNETKRKTLGSVVGLVFFVACLLSITYAFYKWRSNNTNVDIGVHAGGLKFVYSNNNILSSTTLSPVKDYTSSDYYKDNNSSLLYVDYDVTNTKSSSYKMITKLNITSISDSLKDSTFKWVLLKKSGIDSDNNPTYTEVTKGDFSNLGVGENTLDSGIYFTPKDNGVGYRFVIYIDGNQPNSSTMMNSSIVSNLVLCDEEVKLFNISLDNQEADNNNGGTATIYEKYGVGVYKDSNATANLMTATANNISVPLKTGYTFGGYYSKTNGSGDNLINNSGFITDKFTNTYFRADSKIYAKWNINNYTMNVNASNGISKFNVSASDGTSSNNVTSYSQSKPYKTEFTVNNVTAKTGYTYSGYTLNDKLSELSGSSKSTIKVKLGAGTGVLSLNSSANTYNINYNLNSGTAGSSAPRSGTYDKVINISNPSRSGYTFTGWTASSINTSTALYGKTSSTVTNNWSSGSTKVTDSYFKNLNPTNNSTVTLNATWHDSTKPVCTINTPNDVIYQSTVNVKVTCTDNDSLKSNTLSADNFAISNGTIASVQNVSNVSAVNSKQHEYILTIKGLNVGNYTISLKENSVYDTSDNGNAVATSGTGKVTPKSITNSMVSINPTTFVYDGNAKQPTVSVVDGSTTLILNTNYTLSYSNNTNVGTGKVTITGTGNYTGTVTKTFTITAKSIGVPTCGSKTYTGLSQTLLSSGTGYTVSGTTTGIDAGTYSVTVTPTSNYKWSDGTTTSKSVSCTIDKKSIAVTWETTTSFTYNGSAQAPTVTSPVTGVNSERLNLTRTTNTNAGSYTSTASCSSVSGGRAKCSNYTLTNNTKAYTITRKSVSVPSCSTKTYTGVSQTLLSNGTGYTVSGTTTGIDAGTYSVTVTPTGNYQWSDNTTSSKSVSCKIDKKSISVTWGGTTSFTYNGSAQAPTVTTPVTGVNGESINITRTTNTNAGSYTSTASCSSVSGGQAKCSNYNLTNNTKAYTITRKSISVPSCSTKTYTGVSQTLLSNGTGYTVSGTTTGIDAGTYSVTVTPTSNYQWSDNTASSKSVSCKIDKKSVSVTWGTTTSFTYNGYAQAPTVTTPVTGVNWERLNLTRTTQTAVGSHTSTASCSSVSGGQAKCSNYTLTNNTKSFTINKKSISTPTCAAKTYTGTSQTLMSSSGEYTVGGTTTGTDAGTYSVTVTPTSNYQWSDNTASSKSVSCKIDKKSIAVTWGETTTFTYNGSAQAPTVTTPVAGVNNESINITRTTQTAVGNHTSTANCSSVSGGRAKCSNYTLTNNTKSFTITEKTVSVPTCTAKTYTGTSQTLMSSGTGYTVSGTTTGTDAGTYSVTVSPATNYKWTDGTKTSKSVSCKINTKSVSVTWGTTTSFTYNGSAQGPTVTTPVTGVNSERLNLTRTTQTAAGNYTSTASCSSVSGGRAKCSNYSLTNTTKSYSITYTTFSITLNTNKPSTLGSGYYTDGTNTIYMRYSDGVYLDSSYSKKMSTSSNAVTIPTATGYTFGGYYDGNTIMIEADGKISSNFTNTKYSSAKTLTAKWTRNFTCTTGGTANYMGKSWYVISNSNNVCEMALNGTVGNSSGNTYNAASGIGSGSVYSYIKSYSANGTTLEKEYNAGLISLVDGAPGNVGSSKPSGVYWVSSGKIYSSTTYNKYTIPSTTYSITQGYVYTNKNTGAGAGANLNYYSGYTTGDSSSTPIVSAGNTVSLSNTSSKLTYYNKPTSSAASSSNGGWSIYETNYTYNIGMTGKINTSCDSNDCHWGIPLQKIDYSNSGKNNDGTYNGRSFRWRFYSCGGSNRTYDTRIMVEMKDGKTTNSFYYSNYSNNKIDENRTTDAKMILQFGGRASRQNSLSGSATKTGKNIATLDFNNDADCKTTYKKWNSPTTGTVAVKYRPHIKVKMGT